MSDNQPAAPKSSNRALKIILIVVIALVVICIVVPCCIIALLTLMGPSIANIFSRVTSGLGTPMY